MRDSTKRLIEEYKKRIAVMEHEGKYQIETRWVNDSTPSVWFDDANSMWNFENFEYRVKQKP